MNTQIISTGEATGFIPAPDNKGKPITGYYRKFPWDFERAFPSAN